MHRFYELRRKFNSPPAHLRAEEDVAKWAAEPTMGERREMETKATLWSRSSLQKLRQTGVDFLYSLIQPGRIPEEAKPQPRLRVEVLISVVGLICWGVFLLFYEQVSPEAALDLRYDRAQITEMAEAYLRERGVDLQDHHRVTTFGRDYMAMVYLERTVGIEQLQRLVAEEEVPVWTWHVRWFVPEEVEEYDVYLLPSGEIVGFYRTLAEDTPAPTLSLAEDTPGQALSPEEAQQRAEAYLVEDRGFSLEDWELYDVSAETLPNRTDHTLTWVKKGLESGEGDLRTSVTVQGDQVGRFGTWFRVPEAFSRDYSEQRSQASVLDGLATGLAAIFLIGGALVVLWGLVTGLRIGWAPVLAGLVAGLVDLLDSLNYLPLLDAGYNTAHDYQSYVLTRLANYASSAIMVALFVSFLVLAGQWLVRAVWSREHKFKPDPEAPWSHLSRSAWRGMMLGGIMGGYLILFYAIARGLGAWAPLRTPALNLLATPFPFVAAVWIGLLPALTEELTYRGLGIGLMMRLGRGRVWLALLVPALLWGFAHASYPSDPVGLRGIELTIVSLLLLGPALLFFDLTTVVVAHYTYNASLTAMVLVRSGNPTFVVTGLAAGLLGLVPVIVVLVRRLLGRRREKLPAPTIAAGGEEDWREIQALSGEQLTAADRPQRLVCLRSADGRLVGYAVGAVAGDAAGERVGQVLSLFVAKPYRGRYYGTALYRSLVQWFGEQGAREVQVQIPLGNAGASTFWATQRFRPEARSWSNALVRAEPAAGSEDL